MRGFFYLKTYIINMMKTYKLALSLLLVPYLLIAQTNEEVIDDKELLQKAIDIEASSSNDAAGRQEFIDNVDSEIIVLTGDIQFLSQQLKIA